MLDRYAKPLMERIKRNNLMEFYMKERQQWSQQAKVNKCEMTGRLDS